MTQRKDWSGSSLRERVDAILEMREMSQNKLAELAGIHGGVLSRLGTKIKRGSPETLRKVADAGQVSLEWLAFGHGRPEAVPSSGKRERFPNRGLAAHITIDGGVDPGVVAAVVAEEYSHLTRDPSVLWWIHEIEGRALLGDGPPRRPAPTPVAESVKRPRSGGGTKK